MKKRYLSLFLVTVLFLIVGCEAKLSLDNQSAETITPSETALPLSTITLTATQYPTSTATTTPSPTPTRLLPEERISIENAASLEQLAILGDQYTFIPRGFRTLLSPSFDIYAMVENPDSTDGPLLFTLRDASSDAILHTLTGDSGNKFSAAFSPDGRFFAIGNDQGVLSIWNVSTGERILQDEIERFPNLSYSRFLDSITFSPDSNRVVTTSYSGRLVASWDLNLGKRISAVYCYKDSACTPLTFSPDGKYFVTREDGRIDLFDGKTGLFVRGFARDRWVITAYAFSPTGDILAVMDRSLTISLYQFPDGRLMASSTPDTFVFDNYHLNLAVDIGTALAFSPDGKILANGYNKGSYILWDVASLQPICVYTNANYKWHDDLGNYSGIFDLAFSSNGMMLASHNYDNSVTLWGIP